MLKHKKLLNVTVALEKLILRENKTKESSHNCIYPETEAPDNDDTADKVKVDSTILERGENLKKIFPASMTTHFVIPLRMTVRPVAVLNWRLQMEAVAWNTRYQQPVWLQM